MGYVRSWPPRATCTVVIPLEKLLDLPLPLVPQHPLQGKRKHKIIKKKFIYSFSMTPNFYSWIKPDIHTTTLLPR